MLGRRSVAFGAAAVVVSGTLALAAPPAGSIDRGDAVAARPAPGSQLKDGFFLLNLKPGTTLSQTVRVTNPNKHPVTVEIQPVDASTNDLTGTRYGTPGSPQAVTSRWIFVSTPEITLDPNETRDVPYTVHVPPHVGAGQYLAGISTAVPISPTNIHKAKPGDAAFNLALQYQRVIAVEVDVPGARAPQLVVSGADAIARPDGIALGVHIANQGNAFAHGDGVIRVADTNTDYSFHIDTFVSHTSIVYPVAWTKKVVGGLHHIQVDLTYEGGRRTSWSGTVNIAGDLQNQLENSLKDVQVHPHHSPILWLILLGLLFAGLVYGAIRMRRRGRRPGYVKYRTA